MLKDICSLFADICERQLDH